jgi:hypothetical protein
MAITNYATLKTAVTDWMTRSDLSGQAADCIALAEAALNRELDPVETDVTITGVVNSRRIDIASTSCVAPIALFLAQTGEDEIEMTMKTDGTFPYLDSSGMPRFFALDGINIDFDRPLDQAYPFRFRIKQKFALSDTAPTNWLLTEHPDVYLAAAMVWGGLFIQDDPTASRWASLLNSGIPSVRNAIAQRKRAVGSVDPALQPRYGSGRVGWLS